MAKTRASSHRMVTRIGVALILAGPLFGIVRPASANEPDARSKPSIQIGFGGNHFFDDDLSQTYGSLPLFSFRLGLRPDERGEVFLGVQYGMGNGHPFYDTPEFRSDVESTLKMVPIELGGRVNLTSSPRYRFYFGIALQAIWADEEIPFGESYDDGSGAEKKGWGWGCRFLGGPELRLSDRRSAVGIEATVGPQRIQLGNDPNGSEIDFTGVDVRIYLAHVFGRDREGERAQ